jgi:carboxypeptidase C (cathepsin A)
MKGLLVNVHAPTRLTLLIALTLVSYPATAQDQPDGNEPGPTEQRVVTHHAIEVAGRQINYVATAGYMPIRESSGTPLADIFFVAYELEDDSSIDANRPITFAFNGGPGSSSVWLHMGALGPKRALLAEEGTALPRADRLVDNEYTWLEFTDLVFVDPVGTGFSRTRSGVDTSQFYAAEKDVETACAFVRLFVTEHGRWLSPQFIAGESYGTTRAAGMARYLQEHDGLYLNGLVLMSSALDMGAISFNPGNDLPYALSLPSYAAVAQYRGKLAKGLSSDMERTLEEVEAWALDEYLVSLAQGASLPPTRFKEVARQLSQYTGLSEELVAQSDLRISTFTFATELQDGESQTLGLLDGRVTTEVTRSNRQNWVDPSLFVVKGPFVATFNRYIRSDLGFKTNRPYLFLSERANEVWDWGPGRNGYLNVAPDLAQAMNLDTRLRVFAAAGYYDLTTPYLSQEYVLNHLDLASHLRENITLKLYHAGHQIYTSPDCLKELHHDVRAFVTGAQRSRAESPRSRAGSAPGR